MAFIAVDEGATLLASKGLIHLGPTDLFYLYPLKVLAVALVLFRFRANYSEFNLKDLAGAGTSATICLIGVATCVLWVAMDWTSPLNAAPRGFVPTLLPEGPVRVIMTLLRVGGAVLVVPLMEELFWRSFLLRYLLNAQFETVPIGSFSWGSFIATTVLFGLEHHLIIAGMAAGAIYTLILYRTRSIAQCVLAHAVTNLSLAGYVLWTGKWSFW